MNFKNLQSNISVVHKHAQQYAVLAINQSLTLRNWLIGYYIVEYEQNGSDRQKYGSNLLQLLAKFAVQKNIKGLSETNLKLCRRFYLLYPQMNELAFSDFNMLDLPKFPIRQTASAEFKNKSNLSIRQTPSAEFKSIDNKLMLPADVLIQKVSFSHIVELLRVDDPLKRLFYELQTINENWNVKDLNRAINTSLYERTGLSRNKISIIKKLKNNIILTPEETIKNPYILEFIGLPEKAEYSENDLESAIIAHLQQFITELGKGFCFEARQKRITIGNKHYHIDLVFYHRILKCHILIDLKTDGVMHEAVGQMNYYLNYYNKIEKQKNDNAPIGIILSANEDEAEVEFALGNLKNQIFASKYKIALPSERVLKNFIKKDLQKFYSQTKKSKKI